VPLTLTGCLGELLLLSSHLFLELLANNLPSGDSPPLTFRGIRDIVLEPFFRKGVDNASSLIARRLFAYRRGATS
jgi:hypothetical protein